MIYGIDISKYNVVDDWNAIKASGKKFVFIRLGWINSDGSITKDEQFEFHYKNARAVGLDVGVYIYSYLNDSKYSRIAARNTVNMLEGKMITYPVAFDFEEYKISAKLSKSANTDICYEFLSEVQRLGYFAMMYTYTSFVQSYLNIERLKPFAMWIADYRDPTGTNCPYKGNWGIWQYKGNTGKCNGVSGACDLNMSKYDYAATIKAKKLNGLDKIKVEEPKEIVSPYKGKFRISQEFKGATHQGLDLVGVDSKSLYATIDGTVEIAGNNDPNGFGTYVRLRGKDGNTYYYGHMSSVAVKIGTDIKCGDYIGEEGSTGKSTGSHCHYEVRKTLNKSSYLDVCDISGIPNQIGTYSDNSYKADKGVVQSKKILTINAGTWNIRQSPNTASKIVCVVKGGTSYEYTAEMNGWRFVKDLNGWISPKGHSINK